MKVQWVGTLEDFTAKHGDFILRLEKMDTNRWWWAVSKNGSRIGSGFEDTKADAQQVAEEFYWGAKDVK